MGHDDACVRVDPEQPFETVQVPGGLQNPPLRRVVPLQQLELAPVQPVGASEILRLKPFDIFTVEQKCEPPADEIVRHERNALFGQLRIQLVHSLQCRDRMVYDLQFLLCSGNSRVGLIGDPVGRGRWLKGLP